MQVGRSSSAVISCRAGFPRGSVLGPILFTAYVSPIGRPINSQGVDYHSYADDTYLYTAVQSVTGQGMHRLSKYTTVPLQNRFWCNDLLLNMDESDAAIVGTKPRPRKSRLPYSILVAGCSLAMATRLDIFGITLDLTLSFDDRGNQVVLACSYHFRSVRYLRHSLTLDVANTLACSIALTTAVLVGASRSSADFGECCRMNSHVFDVGIRKLHDDGRISRLEGPTT